MNITQDFSVSLSSSISSVNNITSAVEYVLFYVPGAFVVSRLTREKSLNKSSAVKYSNKLLAYVRYCQFLFSFLLFVCLLLFFLEVKF